MPKPNKTVASFLAKHPRKTKSRDEAFESAKAKSPETFAVMEKFQKGELTLEQAMVAMKAATGS